MSRDTWTSVLRLLSHRRHELAGIMHQTPDLRHGACLVLEFMRLAQVRLAVGTPRLSGTPG
jgi:hypothetical protein